MRAFVARETELVLLRSALAGDRESPAVVFVHGAGGIGKTTLMQRFAEECDRADRVVLHLDGRLLDPSPTSFARESAAALLDARAVLLVDAFEHCQGLETWLRDQFLPRLPAGVLVVLAGRRPPSVDWVTDPGWAGALRVIALGELSRPDAVALLSARGVGAEAHDAILDFAGGYPLALALAASGAIGERVRERGWAPTPEAVTTLMRQVIDDIPSPAHLMSLRIGAHALVVTEALLRAVEGEEKADGLFQWLCEQPFVELAPAGALLHGLVKEVVDADFRWRDPDSYAAMHARIGDYLLEQAQTVPDAEAMSVMRGLTYLKRYGAAASYYGITDWDGDVYEDAATPADFPAIRRMTGQCEGPATVPIVEFWLRRRPDAFRVYRRSGTGKMIAYMMWLRAGTLSAEETAADPVVAALWRHVGSTSGLRPGEQMLVCRFLVDPQAYHRQSAIMRLMQLRICVDWIRTARLAWSFVVFANPEVWEPLMTHLGQHQVPDIPPTDGRPYAVFAFDWRLFPLSDWFAHTAPGAVGAAEGPPMLGGAVVTTALSREAFAVAVRDALRDWHRTDARQGNPLLATRMVLAHTEPDADPVSTLRLLLGRAVELLAEDPRRAMSRDVVSRTYFSGITTQAAVAARLHLPWSTYRRHLRQGVDRVVDRLWQWENGGVTEPLRPER